MIPPYLPPVLKSRAEGKLFLKLSELSLPGYTAFHSLNLASHPTKRESECDFVIVSPYGLYVLEVKGGALRCHDGVWTTTGNSREASTLRESPFKQAADAKYALVKRLESKLRLDLKDAVVGHGVVFPDVDFAQQSPEWDLEIVCGASQMSSIRGYLSRLETYWRAKTLAAREPLPASRVQELTHALRPDFELARSLRVEADEVVARLDRFTEEQYRVLDGLDINDRFLVEGGAGTGKSFLALECARRHAARGQRVLLVCYSPVLAAFLRSRLDAPGVTIQPAHQLMLDTVRERGALIPGGYYPGMPITDPWFVNKLIPAFEMVAPGVPEAERFDVLIVDEGQDILNADYLLALEHLLRGGYKDGHWRVFYDACNQGAIFGKLDSEALDMLKAYAPRPLVLKRNCRNTAQIVEKTKSATGADLDASSTSDGPKVEVELYDTPEQGAERATAYLKKLLQQVPEQDVTILSPKPAAQSLIQFLPKELLSRIRVLSGATAQQFPHNGLTFASVADFKGLENNTILLVDIDGKTPGAAETANLYVGMTRARVKLWIAATHPLSSMPPIHHANGEQHDHQ